MPAGLYFSPYLLFVVRLEEQSRAGLSNAKLRKAQQALLREVREIMKWLHIVAFILLVVGGLNWGLIGLLNFNLVSALFGSWPMVEGLVYILVGVSALYIGATHKGDCKICSKM